MRKIDAVHQVEKAIETMTPGFDWGLSLRRPETHDALARRCRVERPPIGYARYAGTVAHRVVEEEFLTAIEAPDDYSARLTNSGMCAIRTALEAAFGYLKPRVFGLSPTVSDILHGQTLYSLTTPLIVRHVISDRRIAHVATAVDSASLDAIMREMRSAGAVLFFETIGNGKGMPVLDVRGLMRRIWEEECVLILDNTFLTCALLNPFRILAKLEEEFDLPPKFGFVYVESLSKHYRADVEDHDPGGIIVAPDAHPKDFSLCDDELQNGGVMANSVLRKFPFSLFDACNRVMAPLSENASAAAAFLRGHPRVMEVWYPDDHPVIQAEAGGRAGGVLYFLLRSAAKGDGKRLMEAGGIPEAASFGHPDTTHIDWSLYGKENGLVRLAIGFMEDPDEVVDKLEGALGPRE